MRRPGERTRQQCPRCGRTVGTNCGRWNVHCTIKGGAFYCPMSRTLVTIKGGNPIHHRRRADLVCELAVHLRDQDPAVVWEYLTATPADEVQRLLMIALAGIDVDRPVSEVFGWVLDLPVAVGVSA